MSRADSCLNDTLYASAVSGYLAAICGLFNGLHGIVFHERLAQR